MPKRKTVKPNLPYVRAKIKEVFRSNVVFCEAMGRPQQKTWVTEWGRGHNLPSPEEAAKMCTLLCVAPEEILAEPADIALVKSLIDQKSADYFGVSVDRVMGVEKETHANDGMDLTNEELDFIKWYRSEASEKDKALIKTIIEND